MKAPLKPRAISPLHIVVRSSYLHSRCLAADSSNDFSQRRLQERHASSTRRRRGQFWLICAHTNKCVGARVGGTNLSDLLEWHQVSFLWLIVVRGLRFA